MKEARTINPVSKKLWKEMDRLASNPWTTRIGKLVHDFKCTSANDMYYDVLAKRVRHFKETEGDTEHMCEIFENVRNEAAEKATLNNIKNLTKNLKLTVDQSMQALGISDDDQKKYRAML